MRWSEALIPTLKETPQDAEIISHQLMLRAGLIRRLGSGLYTYLPLGLRALRKVEAIVREEMDRAGALEVLMPAMHPKEIWERSGRYESLKSAMFRFSDRQEREMVLGPTHEEIITDLVAKEITSYKQLPRNFYQIQTKFRDEIRPRFGLMRCKEFIMKDAYSFDVSSEAADESYRKMYDAYTRIFKRCGLHVMPVEADTGDMGGSSSHEFMVPAESGEDGILEADDGSYAANLERAEGFCDQPRAFSGATDALEEVHTPEAGKIEDVAKFLGRESRELVKCVIYLGDEKPLLALVPGNREVNEIKLRKVAGVTELVMADDRTVEELTNAAVGFAGPVGLDVPIYADRTLEGVQGAVTGANKTDYHLINFDPQRDAGIESYVDIAFPLPGDLAPNRTGRLQEKRGIEVGHVFKLGTKYTEALGADYLDQNGKSNPMVMGCYGIGVSRTLQSILEQSNDKWGIIWPVTTAPYQVHLCLLSPKDPESSAKAEEILSALEAQGIDVLLDDRDERPGFKFKDADLLGLPVRVTLGERSLAKGVVELKIRGADDFTAIPVEDAISSTVETIRALESQILGS